MPFDVRIRLDDSRRADVNVPEGTSAVEVIAAIVTAGRLADGSYWLVRGGQSLQPGDQLTPGGEFLTLEPASLLRGKLDSLPRDPSLRVGSLSVRFSGAAAPSGTSTSPSGRIEDGEIRIVSTKGGPAVTPSPNSSPGGVTLTPDDLGPRSGIFCVGCGAGVQESDEKCRACGTPVRGSMIGEEVPYTSEGEAKMPRVCCCCLGAAQRLERQKMMAEMRGNSRLYLLVPMPWCNGCWTR